MIRFAAMFQLFAKAALLLLVSAVFLLNDALLAKEPISSDTREIPYTGHIPLCDDVRVFDHLSSRFSSREREYWSSDLVVTGVDKIQQVAFRPHGDHYIPRRFCSAIGTFSDERKRSVHYVIGEDLGITGHGFLSANWGLSWCVQGLDRNMAFAPECRMARP